MDGTAADHESDRYCKLSRLATMGEEHLVFAPLFFSPGLTGQGALFNGQSCLPRFVVASGLYCLNDFSDREADKPIRRNEIGPSLR